ncbi:MAG: hypothetical protein MZW92_47770 [Comamonadaceae bacterium]|nr:hypothetical protein [Comamonadaceae bacterium]
MGAADDGDRAPHAGARGCGPRGTMGRVLADFLIEHLPFEESADANMETVRLVLAAGLADESTRRELWQRARRQPHLYLGFLEFEAEVACRRGRRRDSCGIQSQAGGARRRRQSLRRGACRASLSARGRTSSRPPPRRSPSLATHRIIYHLLDLDRRPLPRSSPRTAWRSSATASLRGPSGAEDVLAAVGCASKPPRTSCSRRCRDLEPEAPVVRSCCSPACPRTSPRRCSPAAPRSAR